MEIARTLLAVPPFPGAQGHPVVQRAEESATPGADSRAQARALIAAMRAQRVGGASWATQPALPPHEEGYLVLRTPHARSRATILEVLERQRPGQPVLLWLTQDERAPSDLPSGVQTVRDPLDPWTVFASAALLWFEGDDPLALLAAIAGKVVRIFGRTGRFAPLDGFDPRDEGWAETLETLVADQVIAPAIFHDPFTGDPCEPADIAAMLAHWRALIDGNRAIVAAFGMAFWKRETVTPLLWSGGELPFPSAVAALEGAPAGAQVAVWKARTPPDVLAALEAGPWTLVEVEDGFIRSVGLGADCVPPLSIVVDDLGAHYDASRPSRLEEMLRHASCPPELLERAADLRALIVHSGISKYGGDGDAGWSRSNARRQVLVTGQVEDDRSVLLGGGEVGGNLDLLRRVRAAEPEAHVLYRPHPDVEAGHRKGAVADADALAYADEVVRGGSITGLIEAVDAVHVLTSLAGFEALLRGKDVTTHGTPFYAGWGLTRDLAPPCPRRGMPRSLDELVAATLLLYPRYLDPVTRLPCPPELLVARLSTGAGRENRALVGARRLQGKIRKLLGWGH